MDWKSIFLPDTSLWEIILRGSIMYIALFAMLRRNMRQELITEDELMMELREQGMDNVSQVKEAYIESDGHISVIQSKQRHHSRVERNEK